MARKRLTPAKPQFLDQAGQREATAVPAAGLVGGVTPSAPPIAQVAGEAAVSGALRDLVDDMARARAQGRMVLEIPLSEIAPDHLARDRIAAGAEDMDSLVASIRSHGQRTPIEVAALPDPIGAVKYGLISGWRRLAALEHLSKEDPDRFGVVLALLRDPKDSADAYVAMVEENEIRVGLSYYERARVAVQAVERGVFEAEKQALLTLFATASRAKRSRIRTFTRLYHALDDVLRFPAAIPERLGLALADCLKADVSREPDLRADMKSLKAASPEEEVAALSQFVALASKPKPSAPRKNVPRAEHLDQTLPNGVRLTLKDNCIEISGKPASEALYQRLLVFLAD